MVHHNRNGDTTMVCDVVANWQISVSLHQNNITRINNDTKHLVERITSPISTCDIPVFVLWRVHFSNQLFCEVKELWVTLSWTILESSFDIKFLCGVVSNLVDLDSFSSFTKRFQSNIKIDTIYREKTMMRSTNR
ncbi:hypothetical protein WICPIJ_005558 [Wickerhamomyces pijperi]|uniref:Uncharacterized protein n=1 Tax=Wickerhamomyces pijperi TaxID=599730 RepID=A0A9P8Q616_WICPI|nr:hypothetical protein WICPIJ_005558 [Wickerhamomyces pijperi]